MSFIPGYFGSFLGVVVKNTSNGARFVKLRQPELVVGNTRLFWIIFRVYRFFRAGERISDEVRDSYCTLVHDFNPRIISSHISDLLLYTANAVCHFTNKRICYVIYILYFASSAANEETFETREKTQNAM